MEPSVTQTMDKTDNIIPDLPEDIWLTIFSHLGCDTTVLKSTSMVNKLFCSISSTVLYKISITDSSLSYQAILKVLQRFSSAYEIHINCFGLLDKALLAISNSTLPNLEYLKLCVIDGFLGLHTIASMSTSETINNIKSLKITRSRSDKKEERFTSWLVNGNMAWLRKELRTLPYKTDYTRRIRNLIRLFPRLTDLDMASDASYKWTHYEVQEVMSKLPNLRKINLSNNHHITDTTLAILSSNCPNLESVNLQGCPSVTHSGLYTFLSKYARLTSLTIPSCSAQEFDLTHIYKHLNHLSFGALVTDEDLIAIAELQPPLRSFKIGNGYCDGTYTMDGLSQRISRSREARS